MVAYVVSAMSAVHDEALMGEYAAVAGPTVAAHGGKMLARGNIEVLDGDSPARGGVVIEFPSADAVRAWYASPEYQKIVDMRFRAITSTLLHYLNDAE